jgi:hypothetical protein
LRRTNNNNNTQQQEKRKNIFILKVKLKFNIVTNENNMTYWTYEYNMTIINKILKYNGLMMEDD